MAVAVHEQSAAMTAPRPTTPAGIGPVMVIDPQPLVRASLVSLIKMHLGRETVCLSAASVREAILASQQFDGGCAVLATRRGEPYGNEVEAIADLVMNGLDVLVLVDDPSPESMSAALVVGAKGYLDKDVSPIEFIAAVRTLATGRPCVPVLRLEQERRMLCEVKLSDQERRALVLYASGLTQDVVARRMGIAPNTVKHYLDRVREKYGSAGVRARTKLELHALARAEGLLP